MIQAATTLRNIMLRKEMGEILSLVNLKNDSGCNDLAKHYKISKMRLVCGIIVKNVEEKYRLLLINGFQ